MAITECKPKGIFLLTVVQTDEVEQPSSSVSHIADNVLEVKVASANDIEPLLIALRQYYNTFSAVCFLCSDVELYNELARYFPEIFQSLLKVPSTEASDAGWFTEYAEQAKPLPYFDLATAEPLVSEELKQLVAFFQLDERLTDIAEQEAIANMTQAFIARLSAQRCAFSAFVQIRLLSFFAGKVNKYGDSYFRSLALKFGDNSVSGEDLWRLVLDTRFSLKERFFLYNQLLSVEFNGLIKDRADFKTRYTAFSSLVKGFAASLGEAGPFIDQNDRNSSIVFVFIGQFLSPNHAPSKIVLETIKALCLSAKKQVVLIDTCELLPVNGALPWYDAAYANRGQYKADSLTFEGARFNYLQLSAGMPNSDEIAGVVDLVKTYKPYFTITVGESLVADIISQWVPNVVVPTVARLPHTLSQYRVFNKRFIANADDVPEALNQSILSVDMLPERPIAHGSLTRSMLQLPEQGIVLAVLGNRLDAEITDEFISMLLQLPTKAYFIVFAGVFRGYDALCAKYPALKDMSVNAGYQQDLVAFMQLVDVYVNPPRSGGGLSALCALSVSVPVLTLKTGDVYAYAGDEFAVATLSDMLSKLRSFHQDPARLTALKTQAGARFLVLEQQSDKYTDLFDKVVAGPLFNQPSFTVESNQ
ncbi:Multimeric flavodoxin WrbA family protein [Alishewanella agri BL06]|uniref:Multimeric flavodoxin WrbA family protein n=1 Tax=Alishewanella agri BL06 TaxID=1195246 RepID=I9P5J3_9ALTE|nr:glycosyltransferase [Alishewanella agri]EIW90262.1 Multimeric flavodoxin WrbA family protein [Alishewanella agri BL06]